MLLGKLIGKMGKEKYNTYYRIYLRLILINLSFLISVYFIYKVLSRITILGMLIKGSFGLDWTLGVLLYNLSILLVPLVLFYVGKSINT